MSQILPQPRSRSRRRGAIALGLLAFLNLVAVAAPPNFDLRPPATNAAAAENFPGLQVSRHPVTGAPRLVRAESGFLTPPERSAKTATAKALAATPHRVLKNFLNDHAALFGHGAEVLDTAPVVRDYTTAHNGLRTTVWQQQAGGLDIYEARLAAHVTKAGALVNVASQFVSHPEAASAASNNPTLTAAQALQRAAKNVGDSLAASDLAATDAASGAEQMQHFAGTGLRGGARARLVWLPLNADSLALCWEVTLPSRQHRASFRLLVDAATGEVLVRRCLTESISDATYNVFTSDSPSPFSPGWPTPNSAQPATVSRTLVTLPALDTNASPAGWIPDGGNETLGNNVDAHTDHTGTDTPDLPRPQGSPARVFNFPLNLASDPTNSAAAAVVQLFYWCNFMHDKLYALGFTEAAGNFQSNNFARGGLGGDPVLADAQDGADFNNADMSTDYDGNPPRIQMYLFNGPNPDRDGSLDAEIVLHEYTHGLSSRLVGGGVGMSAAQSRGMGEGWSDFYALALLSEPGDDPDAAYAMGGYATYALAGLSENYYYGIRRYPYSTDLTKSPLTFKDLDPLQASTHADVPRSPIILNTANEVHNMGELWCVTLWEARANLIAKLGAPDGNWLTLQLVTDGMKLAPANPTFLEARDAILQADEVANGGANLQELWAAFAKRGMGWSATSPASSTTSGVVEAFDVPDDLRVLPGTNFIARGPVGGPFTPASWSFTLTNIGSGPLDWITGGSTNWIGATPGEGFLPPGITATVTASLKPAATNLPAGNYIANVRFTNDTSGVIQNRQITLSVGQPDDYFAELFSGNNLDLAFSTLTFTPAAGPNNYTACRMAAGSFPTDPAGGTTLPLTDDSFATVTLSGTNTVAIYAQRTNVLYLCSNGYLTFDVADLVNTSFTGNSYAAHFSRRRVAALFDDLNPGAGGSVSRRELADRIAFTYLGVPLYGSTTPNDFQIELFFDGRIRLTWLNISSRNGMVGLSAGQGLPVLFTASDLSGYGTCSNTAPTLVSPANVTVIAGGTAQFVAGANGSLPMSYQWKFNGTNLPTATNAALTLANTTTANAGNYALAATNAFGGGVSSNALLTVLAGVSLAAALDTTNLTWTTGGAAAWTGGITVTHDGMDAALSGTIADLQDSWVQTVVTNGPGTLSFWWRASSETNYDFLEFYTNNVLNSGRITGETSWQQRTLYLPAGSQNLKWRYTKDNSVSTGQDRGWLDEVRFTPDVPLRFTLLPLTGTTLGVRLESAGSDPLQAAQAGRVQFYATTNLALSFNQWTLVTNPLVLTNGGLELRGLSRTNASQQFLRAFQNP